MDDVFWEWITTAAALYKTLKREAYKLVHPLTNPIEEFCQTLDIIDILIIYTILFFVAICLTKRIAAFSLTDFKSISSSSQLILKPR
jgi:hypothetical protein